MVESTTPPRFPTIRVNLLRAHGSPTRYQYRRGCKCTSCRAAVLAVGRRYVEEHREEVAARRREQYLADREHRCEMSRRWREENPERLRSAGRRWAKANPDKCNAATQRYYRANAARHLAWTQRRRETHPEEERAMKSRRRARKAAAAGGHTAQDIRSQMERQRGRCYWCDVKVGGRYHVDHVMPLALGGSNGPENIVIACPDCNLEKHAKHPMDFAGVMF